MGYAYHSCCCAHGLAGTAPRRAGGRQRPAQGTFGIGAGDDIAAGPRAGSPSGRPMFAPMLALALTTVALPAEEDHTACPTIFNHQLPGPAAGCSDAARASWLAGMKACRAGALKGINYTGGVFETAQVAWTQQAFAVPMVASFDREIYDDSREYAPGEHGWTVDKFLAGIRERYGGADAVLLWPTYENLGVDDRNQVALYQALPGGFEGMTNLTDQLHARGVKVLWAYNPWDVGTKNSAGLATGAPNHAAVLSKFIELLKGTHADGINGDTMQFVPEDWWNVSVKIGWPLALEPEGGGAYPALNWETMSVCHCNYKPGLQTVDHYKWLDARFQTSVRDRWSHDHTDALQFCVFNGVGFETTENDWGTWNEFTARDKAAMKRIFTLLRFFGKRELLTSPDWVPHVAGCLQSGVFASLFPRSGESLYTLVNRGGNSSSGAQLKLPQAILTASSVVYDCWRGSKLQPSADGTLSFAMESEGYGCVLVTTQARANASPELTTYLHVLCMCSLSGLSPTKSRNGRDLPYTFWDGFYSFHSDESSCRCCRLNGVQVFKCDEGACGGRGAQLIQQGVPVSPAEDASPPTHSTRSSSSVTTARDGGGPTRRGFRLRRHGADRPGLGQPAVLGEPSGHERRPEQPCCERVQNALDAAPNRRLLGRQVSRNHS
eukprot:COSAG05_NODE_1209_length_5506_cov_3.412613_1_plen_664_part_00